ncbi:MAG: phytoene/squalene synthase family protein [Candidatus Thermoplasmatota archaeon]|nr:phytoene/squalene synthase family protein [Candidatus Thermoplasmatota archaeon]
MAQSQENRTANIPGDGLERSFYDPNLADHDQPIDIIRAAVDLTKEAAHAISITALEAVREGALFMGVIGSRGELVNPFKHIDAAIWTEPDVPDHMIQTAYDFCEELTKREAGNFYHSFKYLPEDKRRSIMAYYAFCRRADDIADGDYVDVFPGGSSDDPESLEYRAWIERLSPGKPVIDRSSYNDKMSQLFYYRKKLSTAYGNVTSTDPIFIALKDTVRRFGINRQLLDDMISGMENDFHRNRYPTFEELYSYCYRVASTVGLVCIEIYGYDDPRTREFAESWGVYMQLINIIRDVQEDAERDRIYLPIEDLARWDITEEDIKSGKELLKHPGWAPFVKEYMERAEFYRERSFKLLPHLDKSSRYSPAAMTSFYSSIMKKIMKRDGDVFTERVQLSKPEKMFLAAYVYVRFRFIGL